MAIVWRIVRGEIHEEGGDYSCPAPPEGNIRGCVRLWYEQPGVPGKPASKSPFYLLIGDDLGPVSGPLEQRFGEPVTVGHMQRAGGWQDILTARGLSIEDYNTTRSFMADLALPAEMIDSYTG